MSEAKRGCENERIEVKRSELPLSCPRSDERVWDAHPRVYLPISEAADHKSICPYCGTEYHLID